MKAAIVIIILLGGVGFFIFSQRDTPSNSNNPQSITNSGTSSTSQTSDNSSRYIEYSKTNLESSSTSRRVLYFYANWCPTCRSADADFRENSEKIPEDVTLIRVNYNDSDTDSEEKDLATKYGITYQHTFVQIDSNGNAVTKWNGGQIEELLKNIKK